jgi:tetraacyldisaccharide 4'-kinase
MNLYPYQKLFFTTFSYATPRPVFSEGSPLTEDAEAPLDCLAGRHVPLLTGIASPKQMLLDIQNEATPASITPMAFADHHRFSRKDIRRINEALEALPQPRLVITTEKDAARLYEVEGLSPAVRQATYALPVKVSFMLDGEETFNETIRNYVLKNSRNSILATGKSETKVRRADKSEEKPQTISFK